MACSDAEVVSFSTQLGEVSDRVIPLRNAGNIHLSVLLEVVSHKDIFSVHPQQLHMAVGSEMCVTVRHQPTEASDKLLERWAYRDGLRLVRVS